MYEVCCNTISVYSSHDSLTVPMALLYFYGKITCMLSNNLVMWRNVILVDIVVIR